MDTQTHTDAGTKKFREASHTPVHAWFNKLVNFSQLQSLIHEILVHE